MSILKPRTILFLVGIASLGVLGFALYLQHYRDMAPCPFCVIQRYAFFGVALFALIGAFGNSTRMGGAFALLSSLSGIGVAARHVWIKAHPTVSCGIDPMETMLNRIITAEVFPQVFRADGLCTTPYDPIMGLQITTWSLISFIGLTVLLIWSLIQHRD